MESPERSLARRAAGKAVRAARERYRSTVDRSALVDSDLFDHTWYSHCVGREMTRDEAVDHYLEHGRANQWTPNPLFDPDFFVEKNEELVVPGQDPFVTYVRGRHWWAQVHPMVMIRRYNNDFPEALDYPTGPIGHYLDIGAARGHRINAWYDENDKSNPRGLADWIRQRVTAWHESRAGQVPLWGAAEPERRSEEPPASRRDIGRVSVLVVVRDAEALDETLASVLSQSYADLEVIVAPLAGVAVPERGDERVRVIPPSTSEWAAFNAALEVATGSWVAPTLAGDVWLPARLDTIAASMDESSQWAHDIAEDTTPDSRRRFVVRQATRQILECGGDPELSTVLCATALARAVGGFDERLAHAAGLGFVLKLALDQAGTFVPSLGLRFSRQERRAHVEQAPSRRPWFSADEVPGYRDLALNDVLVDWRAAEGLEVDQELTTIIVPTYNDYTMTREAVWDVCFHARYDDTPVEIIVVDNGCPQLTSVVLASLEHSYAFASQVRRIKVLHSGPNLGFALGNNLALQHATGSVVIFLNNDTLVDRGWILAIRDELEKPDVIATQPLLVYEGGAIQSAGIAFPPGSGVPHAILQGFPREDALGLEGYPLRALTGAALAVRREDALAMRGFDPVFRNGMEDIDFCLRLAEHREGHCTLLPKTHVMHFESRTPGRFTHSLINRQVFLDRWRGQLHEDDIAAWAAAGYTVVGHEIRQKATPDQRICVAEPVVHRTDRAVITEQAPRLRWAIKNPAPYSEEGARWGDTHYAKALATALRKLGQDAVVDHRPEFIRSTAWHDDVNVLLRGLAGFSPTTFQVNLMWVISHPEMLGVSEGTGWDQIYVASAHYTPVLAEKWASPVSTMLQATDPNLFHPDRAKPDHGHPLLFLGNSRRQKRPMVMWSLEQSLPISVIGADWDDMVPDGFVRGEFLDNDEAGAAYRSAGFVLNDHWDDMRDLGFMSNRLFDAVAAGGRVISDDVVGLQEIFGDAVKVVRSSEELAEIVRSPDPDAIFGTDAERRARAAHIAEHHSFDRRAERMLDDAVRAWRVKHS